MGKKLTKIFLTIFLLFFMSNVNASPANDSFNDDDLYKCIIDEYNEQYGATKDYSYSILPEELTALQNLDCSSYFGKINDLYGLNKLTSITNLNLSGNLFWGAKLTLDIGETSSIKSNIILPLQISLTDVSYSIDNDELVKISNGVVTALKGGSTYITMTAKTTGNNITEKYLVVVNSNVAKSDNGNLSSLSLSYGTIAFKSNIKKYSVIVPKTISSIKISASLEDSNASFVSGYGPRTVSLKVGTNTIYVKVKAADGSVNIYTLGIVRSDGTDSDNLLSNIELSVGDIEFDSSIDLYSLSVAYEVDRIEVTPVTESVLASAVVSSSDLSLGENKITITVTAENGNEKEYTLIVTRENYESKNNYLSNLIITNYPINFNKTENEYEVIIKSESSLAISASPEKITSGVSVIGNKNLTDGSEIIIRVTDKDNLTRDYVINIKKSVLYDMGLKEYVLIIEWFTIIALIVLMIKKIKNKKNGGKKRKQYNANKVCPNCGTVNNQRSNTCYVCGKELK